MYSHFVKKQVAIVIVSSHHFSHTYSCQAVADKLLARYDLSTISMLNKQDKKTFLSVYTCLTAGSVCDAVFTGLPARWAIKQNTVGQCQPHRMRDTNKSIVCTGRGSDVSSISMSSDL